MQVSNIRQGIDRRPGNIATAEDGMWFGCGAATDSTESPEGPPAVTTHVGCRTTEDEGPSTRDTTALHVALSRHLALLPSRISND